MILPFVIDAILKKIFSWLFSGVASIFSWVIKTLLLPAIMFLIDKASIFLFPIIEMFYGIQTLIIKMVQLVVFSWFLMILEVVEQFISIFVGTEFINYKGQDMYMIEMLFTDNTIARIFQVVTLIGIVVCVAASLYAVSKQMVSDDKKKTIIHTFKTIGKTLLTFLLVPFFIVTGIMLTSRTMNAVDDAITGGGRNRVALAVFATAVGGADKGDNLKDYMQDNGSGKKDYLHIGNVLRDFYVMRMDFSVAYFVAIFLLVILLGVSLSSICRFFEVGVLYIASPIFIASIPFDEGKKFKAWRDLMIGKLLSGFGVLIAMDIWGFVFVPLCFGNNIIFSQNAFLDIFIRYIFLVGSAWAMYKSNSIMLEIINPQAAKFEKMTTNYAVETTKEVAKIAAEAAIAVASGGTTAAASAGRLAAKKSGQKFAQKAMQTAGKKATGVAKNSMSSNNSE